LSSNAHKHLLKLADAYVHRRNLLAHGRAQHGEFMFFSANDSDA
jgi:hypothetical protein